MYNSARTIEKCVENILKQTYQDIEVLLINDCSKDNTFQIAKQLASLDHRIRLFNNDYNVGAGLTRNQGLQNATGEWVTFCDADDFPDKTWIEDFVTEITDDVDLVVQGFHSDNWPHNNTGRIVAYEGCNKRDVIVDALCKHDVFGYLWCKMYRTSIIIEHDLRFKKIVMIEDEMFNLQYLKYVRRIVCSPKCNYHYDCPDFYTKYGHIDNYRANIDMFVTACDSFGSKPMRVKDMFVDRISDWLLAAYKHHQTDKVEKLSIYCSIIRPYLPYAKNCRRSTRVLRYFIIPRSIRISNLGVNVYIMIQRFIKR